jgi:hypothetical protein
VLARFLTGVTPDAEDARLVLARVSVATWSDCPEDAAFLEAELLERLETGRDNDNDLMIIGGLMAFLHYCRIVLFDRTDDSNKAGKAAMAKVRGRSQPGGAVVLDHARWP